MKDKWVKDVCPFAKDQGFTSVVGDVEKGISVFGFSFRSTGTDAIVFKTVTGGRVTQMESFTETTGAHNTWYQVSVTKISSGSAASTVNISTIGHTGFTITAESGEDYDVIVRGRIAF